MTALRLALRSMSRRMRATLLVVVPVALLFALLTFLLATQAAMTQLMEGGLTTRSFRLGSVKGVSVSKSWFSAAELTRMKGPNVELGPGNFYGCFTDENDRLELLCGITNRTYIEIWDHEMHVPPAELDHWDATKNGVIITRTIARKHNWKVGDHITVYWKGLLPTEPQTPQNLDLEVTYIVDHYLTEHMIYIHIPFWEQRFNTTLSYWVVWLLTDRPENRQAAMDKLDSELTATHRPHTIWTMEQSKAMIAGSSALLRGAFTIAGAFSFLLILSVAMTLLILSVEQRTTEIATLRAIGFRKGVLSVSIVMEGVLTLLPGAALGAFSMWYLFHDKPVMFDLIFKVKVSWEVALAGAIGGGILGAIAAIVPASRVYRLDVLSSLR